MPISLGASCHHRSRHLSTITSARTGSDGKKWDGIYLGRRKGKELIYAGKVDHGFDSASAKHLQARLKPRIRETQPYAKKIAHRGIWVEPSLLAEIEYTGRSQPRARCAILSSRTSGRIYELARGLDMGDRHRRRPTRCARRSLLFVRMNDEAHSQICTSVCKTRIWMARVCVSRPWSTAGNIPTRCRKPSSSSTPRAAPASPCQSHRRERWLTAKDICLIRKTMMTGDVCFRG